MYKTNSQVTKKIQQKFQSWVMKVLEALNNGKFAKTKKFWLLSSMYTDDKN